VSAHPSFQNPLFANWLDIDTPTVRQRLVVTAFFSLSGFFSGALVAVLPGADLHFHNMWTACVCATISAFLLSHRIVSASRSSSHLRVASLSAIVTLLSYVVFAVLLPLAAAMTSTANPDAFGWPMAAYIGLLMPVLTGYVYLPAALGTGLLVAHCLRRIWPLSTSEAAAVAFRRTARA